MTNISNDIADTLARLALEAFADAYLAAELDGEAADLVRICLMVGK